MKILEVRQIRGVIFVKAEGYATLFRADCSPWIYLTIGVAALNQEEITNAVLAWEARQLAEREGYQYE